jgi:hypothetical protein
MEMCIIQQAFIFAFDGRDDIAALGKAIAAGNGADINAVMAGVVTGPNWADLDDDQALLGAVQERWPTVASAKFTQDGDRRD